MKLGACPAVFCLHGGVVVVAASSTALFACNHGPALLLLPLEASEAGKATLPHTISTGFGSALKCQLATSSV